MSRVQQCYYLVKSLTRGQKRYFNLYISKYANNKDNNLNKLFKLYDQTDLWDEKKILAKIAKEDYSSYYSTINTNLLDTIITALIQQNGSKQTDFEINKLLDEVRILIYRELFDLSYDKVVKAKTIAYAAEKYERLFEILNIEKYILLIHASNEKFKKRSDEISDELEHIFKLLQNEKEFVKLSENTFYTFRKIGTPKNNLENEMYDTLFNDHLLNSLENADTLKAKSAYCTTLFFQRLKDNNYEKGIEILQTHEEILERNEHFLFDNFDSYLSVLNNKLYLFIILNNESEIKKLVKKIKNIPSKYKMESNFVNRRIFESTNSLELFYYTKTLNFEEANELIASIENEFKFHIESNLSLDRFLSIAFSIALIEYYQYKLKESHKWVDIILENENKGSNIHILYQAKILDLILYYLKGDYAILVYRIQAVKRYLEHHNRLNDADKLFLNLLHKLSSNSVKTNDEINNFITFIQAELNPTIKDFYFGKLKIDLLLKCKMNNDSFTKNIVLAASNKA